MTGEITLKKQGIITVYSCSCGGDVEPSEIGYFCECGAIRFVYSDEQLADLHFTQWEK